MKHIYLSRLKYAMRFILLAAAAGLFSGCAYDSAATDSHIGAGEQRVFTPREISPQQAEVFLSALDLGVTTVVPKGSTVAVRGSASDLYRAGVLMDLVDTREEFCIETLASASRARTVPANGRTAAAVGDITIGTFANPPQHGERTRAIIDIHGSSVVAIVPTRIRDDLLAFVRSAAASPRQIMTEADADKPQGTPDETIAGEPASTLPIIADGNEPTETAPVQAASVASEADKEPNAPQFKASSEDAQETSETASSSDVAGVLEMIAESASCEEPGARDSEDRQRAEQAEPQAPTKRLYDLAPLANGEDLLQLDLPDQVEVSQLLDLAAEYLHIDYMYDPEKIRGQTVSLRLHGKLQGEIRVRDLYPLLESVLKFKGFAMTRHKDNLVTIMPMSDALESDPTLMDPNGTSLGAGDMVVTRVFNLQYVNPSSAMSLLDNMKVSVASSVVEETRSLIVTCYAHRMERVERLIEMVDRPGRPKAFRFRALKHTTAGTLCRKVEMLVSELQTGPVEISPLVEGSPAGLRVRAPLMMSSGDPMQTLDSGFPNFGEPRTVYLDADERTNRILMVGLPEQLAVVDEVIDALDVVQQDQRAFKSYEIKHLDAGEVRKHLAEFKLVDEKETRTEGHLDIPPVHVDSGEAPVARTAAGKSEVSDREKPQVSVVRASNSLLINATPIQHVRIAHVIEYVDTIAREESIPYEIYFLENQDPEHMAEVLRRLLQESIEETEAKIEKVLRKTEDEIVIVPDKNTFSLIVYASRKNQDWIRKLIKTLDKRRPQVLIDATLVEIRKNDQFNYDLEVIAGLPDLTPTSGQIPPFDIDDSPSGRNRFAEFHVKSGKGVGFYADEHIQALLTAVQSKDYGRVLAKPKVLVNDNEKGNIKTADTTYVETKSSVPVASGNAGQQNQLIETAVGYEPYEAGITLEITPHISDGDLLRLEVNLSRSDFTSVSDTKPPNQTSSNVGTVVTVPDGSTIILGGMLKLNQNKGGSKVPILGDLPLVGGLFRSVDTSDVQSMLYIFVRAEVIRPAEAGTNSYEDLKRISDANREAFEKHEQEFQGYQTWPGVKPKPASPPKVLDAR